MVFGVRYYIVLKCSNVSVYVREAARQEQDRPVWLKITHLITSVVDVAIVVVIVIHRPYFDHATVLSKFVGRHNVNTKTHVLTHS